MVLWDIYTGHVAAIVDLSRYGRVWAVRRAPSGVAIAMVEGAAGDVALVTLDARELGKKANIEVVAEWKLPGTNVVHDFDVGMVPREEGVESRGESVAVYVVETPSSEGRVVRFVVGEGAREREGEEGAGAGSRIGGDEEEKDGGKGSVGEKLRE